MQAKYLVLLLVASGCTSVQATPTPSATPTGSSGIIRVTGTVKAEAA